MTVTEIKTALEHAVHECEIFAKAQHDEAARLACWNLIKLLRNELKGVVGSEP